MLSNRLGKLAVKTIERSATFFSKSASHKIADKSFPMVDYTGQLQADFMSSQYTGLKEHNEFHELSSYLQLSKIECEPDFSYLKRIDTVR